MTDKQLEKMGLIKDGYKLNTYWCNATQCYIKIFRQDKIEDVIESIFNEGLRQGISQGKRKRSEQIKAILNNEDI